MDFHWKQRHTSQLQFMIRFGIYDFASLHGNSELCTQDATLS